MIHFQYGSFAFFVFVDWINEKTLTDSKMMTLMECTDLRAMRMPSKLSKMILAGEVPCLSVRNPWAWAIFNGKDVENRTWKPKINGEPYSGPVIIQSSASVSNSHHADVDWIFDNHRIEVPDELYFGCALGVVELTHCTSRSKSRWSAANQFQWVMNRKIAFPEPIEMKGNRGLFFIEDSEILSFISSEVESAIELIRNLGTKSGE